MATRAARFRMARAGSGPQPSRREINPRGSFRAYPNPIQWYGTWA
jgi:hypothetical protein